MFHIVQPCANGPRRFEHATVVSSHRTSDDAFAELERVRAVFDTHGLTGLASALTVVTDDRSPVRTSGQTIEPTPAVADTSERHPNGNGRGKPNGRRKNNIEIRIPPTDGWEFVEPAPAERIALVPRSDGCLEVWRLEPDGAFSRMSALETALGQLQRDEIATPLLTMAEPPAPRPDPPPVAKARAHGWSFWSDYHVRIRWPQAVGPLVRR